MPLLLVDLDNTLIDRAGAFGRRAQELTATRGSSAADAQWLVAAGQPLDGAWMIGSSPDAAAIVLAAGA